MEHDAAIGKKSTRPSLVSSNHKAPAAGVNILSNIESGKKSQQAPQAEQSGLKVWLICGTLIFGASAIAYQLLSADVSPPKLEITSADKAKPKVETNAVPPASGAQTEDVAQIVNVVTPESTKGEAIKESAEAKNLAETKTTTDATTAQSVTSSDTPFDDLAALGAQPVAKADKTVAKTTQPNKAVTASKQMASNTNTALPTEKSIKQEPAIAKTEAVREAPKAKPKAKDHDAELIAAIISHEKVAPKSETHTTAHTNTAPQRNNKNSTLKVAQSGVMANQEGIEGLMAQCEDLDFLEKMSCRHEACAGYWGKDAQCPTDEMAEKVLGKQGRY